MATHSSILDWRIPWTEPGGLQSMGLQRVEHNWAINTLTFWCIAKWLRYIYIYSFRLCLSQDIEYSSLCYTAGPCCLSILYIIVYIQADVLLTHHVTNPSWDSSWCLQVSSFPRSLLSSHICTVTAVICSLHNDLIIQSHVLLQWDSFNSPWPRLAQSQPGSGIRCHICTTLPNLQNIFTWHFLFNLHISPGGISFK